MNVAPIEVSFEAQAPFDTPEVPGDAYIVPLPLVEIPPSIKARGNRESKPLWAYAAFVSLNEPTVTACVEFPFIRGLPMAPYRPDFNKIRGRCVSIPACHVRYEDDREGHQRDLEYLPQQDAPPDHKLEHKQEQYSSITNISIVIKDISSRHMDLSASSSKSAMGVGRSSA